MLPSLLHGFFSRNDIPRVNVAAADFSASGYGILLMPRNLVHVLHEIWFTYANRRPNSLLIERDDIVASQQMYLHGIARCRRKIEISFIWMKPR